MPPSQTSPESTVAVAAFYKFVEIADCESLRDRLLAVCRELNIKGTILLASEGINGTIAGQQEAIACMFEQLRQSDGFADLPVKISFAPEPPFHRLKVKIKSEIVTMGVDGIAPAEKTGIHVSGDRWNELLQDPDVLTIDTRNQYEYEIGTFQTAISPQTDNFRQFPDFVRARLDPKQHKRIAMFCTGGIRCEKASAYLLEQGFEEVYQLDGGILKYLEEQSPEASMWEGECFVFDSRVAVNDTLDPGSHILCYACRRPLSPADCQSEHYHPGISCPHCYDSISETQLASFSERRKQVELAEMRNRKHVGALMPRQQKTSTQSC